MNRFGRVATAILVAGMLAGCMPGKVKLTDGDVVRYVKAYRAIRSAAPQIAGDLQKGGGQPSQADLAKFDGAVKQAGFKDYAEFVKVNAAVAWAFSQAKAGAFMKETDGAVNAAAAEIDQKLADPAVPAEVKAQLRTQKEQIKKEYAKNKGWADVAMGLTGALTDEASVAVVQRHAKEIEAAYTGH